MTFCARSKAGLKKILRRLRTPGTYRLKEGGPKIVGVGKQFVDII